MIYIAERKIGRKWVVINQTVRSYGFDAVITLKEAEARALVTRMQKYWPDEKYRVARYKRVS